jgi:hypothetical protein
MSILQTNALSLFYTLAGVPGVTPVIILSVSKID